VKLRFRGPDGAIELSSNLLVLIPFDIVEDENRSISWGECGDSAVESNSIDDGHSRRPLGTRLNDVREVAVITRRFELDPALSEPHQNLIHRHAVEPGGKCRFTPEGTDLSIELHEDVLSNVFGFGRIAHHSKAERVDSAVMPSVERFERFEIACGGEPRKLQIALGVRVFGLHSNWS